jgi:hypothetical protein
MMTSDTTVARGGLMDPTFCLMLIMRGIDPTISMTAKRIKNADNISLKSNIYQFAAKVGRRIELSNRRPEN